MSSDDASEKTTFERVLEEFKKDLPDEEHRDYSGTTLQELKAHIAAIQARQKKTKKVQNMTRLEKFLEAMETYSKVVDVFVNVHSFVAFIWGPMKFLLLTASAFAEAFNGLLDAYKNIGESLPLLEEYQSLFAKDARVQYVLEMIFQDIFEFHRKALQYFRKSAWKQIFHATWSTFKTSIGPILESLKQHRRLLVDQAALEHYRKAAAQRQATTERFKEQQEWERTQRRTHLLSWLSAGDVYKYQDQGVRAREDNPLSGNWILRKDAFRAWSDPYTVEPLLWIYGKPGIGKSVLASLIVEEMKKLRSTTVLSFYCRQTDPERNTFVAMARSLLWQLLIQDDTLIEALFSESIKSGELSLKTQKVAGEVLETALQASGKTCIIIDGLDECSGIEQKHIVKWLRKYVDKSGFGFQACRCLVLSQYDGTTKSLLSKLPTLHLSASDNRADLVSYCKNWGTRLRQELDLDAGFASDLAIKIAQYSDGMFLYARLMMHHLSIQTNLYDLQNEMSRDTLPKELNEVYKLILGRVLDPENPPRQRDALQLLEWLVCATRPFTWEEIQTAICIDSVKGEVNQDRRRIVDAHYICGALIEVGPKGEIELIHSTARAYLLKTHIDCPASHLRLASLCAEYLCFPMFGTALSDNEIDEHLINGAYGFFDYAIVNWRSHVELAVQKGRPSTTSLHQFKALMERFMASHWQWSQERVTIPKHALETVNLLQNNDERLLKTLASIHRLTTTGVSDISGYATLDLFGFLLRVRNRMEHLASNGDDENCDTLERFYGPNKFKCSRLYCKWFYRGFEDAQMRQSHTEKHERPFHCSEPGCPTSTIGCVSKKDLDAHIASYHELEDAFPPDLPVESNEPVQVLSVERENATTALEDAHEEEPSRTREPEERPSTTDEPKEPKEPLTTRHRSRKRPKTTHPCEECSKTFTRRYNLETHVHEKHSDSAEKEFPCSICGKGFHRKSDRKRHEAIHSNHVSTDKQRLQPSQQEHQPGSPERPIELDVEMEDQQNGGLMDSFDRPQSTLYNAESEEYGLGMLD